MRLKPPYWMTQKYIFEALSYLLTTTSSQYLVCVQVSVSHKSGEHHRCEMKASPGPQLAVKEVPWWRHVYRLFHAALLDIINTTTKASCVYKFLAFFLSVSLSLWSQNLSCLLKVLCGLVSKRWDKCDTSSASDLCPLGLHFHELFFKATSCIDSCYHQRNLTFKNNQHLFYSFETEE